MRRLYLVPIVSCLCACEARPPTDPGPSAANASDASGVTPRPDVGARVIDWDARAAEALARADRPGAIVVLDPETGTVLASVERAGASPHPATQPRTPGSVVKPLLALAAIHEGQIEPDETIACAGPREIDGVGSSCFAEHGELDLAGGLRTSCNHYAYALAERLGRDGIERHFARFGVDTGGGAGGAPLVGTGHGGVAISPRGVALAYAALATGGPIAGVGEGWPYTTDELALVHGALRGVVDDEGGTGRAAAVEGLAVAGKTGTADVELDGGALRLNWFAGWAPAAAPEVVIVVQLEGEGTGGGTAAPVAGELFGALAPD